LSNKIVTYWTNFAKFGDPNGQEQGEWTPYSSKIPKLMVFDVSGDKAACTMTDTPKYKGNAFSR